MELELSVYSLDTLKSNKKSFYKLIEFHDKDFIRAENEKLLLKIAFDEAIKRNTKLYVVNDKSKEISDNLGFFAISVGSIDVNGSKIPSAVLDCFILNNKFRKYTCEPNQNTLGIELFREILTIINNISNHIGIRYIILEPLKQEEKLIDFYKKFGFNSIPEKNSTWMYLDIKELS